MHSEGCQRLPQQELRHAEDEEVRLTSVRADREHIGAETPNRFDDPIR